MPFQMEYPNSFCANVYWHIVSFHDYNLCSMELSYNFYSFHFPPNISKFFYYFLIYVINHIS